MSKVRLQDVAEMADVSRATASMALNNYDNISPETRDRVVHAARRLGYLPQQQKRQRASRDLGKRTETGTIVFAVCGNKSFDTNPYYASIISGAMHALKAAQRKVIVCHWLSEEMASFTLPAELAESTVAGAIMTGWCDEGAVECIRRAEVPVVTVDTNVVHPACDSVGPDNHEAIRRAYRHLRELGHEKIVAVLGNMEHVDWQKKLDAFRAMAAAEGLAAAVVPQEGRPACDLWEDIRVNAPDATAILATWDEAALGLLSVWHARGVRCPEEVSVIGIDGAAAGASSAPPLTTVNTDQKGMGELAALQLMQRIAHPGAPIARIMPRPELVKRASCRPPRS